MDEEKVGPISFAAARDPMSLATKLPARAIHPANRWLNKKFLLRSFAAGIGVFLIATVAFMRAQPEEGHAFERLPTLIGTYKCCESGGRYSKSWVDTTQVFCLGASYFQLSTGRDDCGLKSELSGRLVSVERAFVPTVWGKSAIVVRIASTGNQFNDTTDQRLRRRWIDQSLTDAFTLAWIAFVLVHCAQLSIAARKAHLTIKPREDESFDHLHNLQSPK